MSKNASIQAIRGMKDILPKEVVWWHKIEALLRGVLAQYGYEEIRFPMLEQTQLFKRAIGEVTDIVEKEMYTFLDRNGDSLSLRPEGTAPCVRAAIENGLLYNQTQKLWYYGPMFRHERPQKGRYRQFYQLGVEAFGDADPVIDAEQVVMTQRLWESCGIAPKVTLQINSLGTAQTRKEYKTALVDYLQAYKHSLDEDSQRRLLSNPLRILDSKNPDVQQIVKNAPKLLDYLSVQEKEHFESFKGHLSDCGVAYEINPALVRGLDYYCHTVYEWVTDALGAQGTVCAGGRYDGLVELLGGKPTPSVGFAIGLERLIALMQANEQEVDTKLDAYLILLGDKPQSQALQLAERLRQQAKDMTLLMGTKANPKTQFKKADSSGARFALIIGEEELEKQQVAIKFLRENKQQYTINISDFKIEDLK